MRPGTYHYAHAVAPKFRRPASTARTERLLVFVRGYIAEHGYGPTVREMAEAIEVATPSVAAYHLERLRADGRTTFEDGKSRTVRVLE